MLWKLLIFILMAQLCRGQCYYSSGMYWFRMLFCLQ